MRQQRLGIGESQVTKSDTPENCGVRAPDALWVRKVSRQATPQQIQEALFFFIEFVLVAQNLPALVKSFRTETPTLTSESNCRPLARRRPFTCGTSSAPQVCEVHFRIEVLLFAHSDLEVLLSLSNCSHIPSRRRPCGSSRPYSQSLL